MQIGFILLLIVTFISGCSTATPLQSHPGYLSPFWTSYLKVKFEERGFFPSVAILKLIEMQTEADHEPRFPKLPDFKSNDLMKQIKVVLKKLPAKLASYLDHKFYGIFLVENLGRTGFTFFTYNENGEPTGGWIVLDTERIKRDSYIWFNEHEQMPYGMSSP